MKCKKILIVDDDEAIRESIRELLEMENYEVIEAENGKVALDYLIISQSEDLPGLIILDMMMPVMDGRTFLMELENQHMDHLGSIPVILASANAHFTWTSDINNTIERFKKPFNIDELLDATRKHCGEPTYEH